MTEAAIRDTTSLADFFAQLIAAKAGVTDPRITAALATVPREAFLGPGPWPIASMGGGYVRTPSADPAFIYGDVVVGLIPERALNNGEPSFHARCLEAAAIKPGDRVVHVGAGVGYFTAWMAELAGPQGEVLGLEIDPDLAARAVTNLKPWPQARVENRSGLEGPFPATDVIYINAGVSQPATAWLDALKPGGRLIIPLTNGWFGAVFMLAAHRPDLFEARMVSPTAIIPAIGGQDPDAAARLGKAFSEGRADLPNVRSLRRGTPPDGSCWLEGGGWWLSTSSPA